MTVTINPIVLGILGTIVVEFLLLLVYGFYANYKEDKKKNDAIKASLKYLKEREENENY